MSTPPLLSYSARRINCLATNLAAKTYLEVGVHQGGTFLGVDMPRKIGVDPKFRFDFAEHQSESVRFFEVTSDEYFIGHVGPEKLDIIFLDGLHTFEQTFRDFCNSLLYCHDRTVWLIDDTVPKDVFSTLKDQKRAIRFRRAAGGEGGAWHGDVFKMVFAIHDFFPTLSYCTLKTNGGPQTLVWKQPRPGFAPSFNSLEAISRLDYFDFRDNEPLFCYVPEEEGLALALAALTGRVNPGG